MEKKERVIYIEHIIALIFLLFFYGIFLLNKTDLTTVDLGRHIKNGQMVLSSQLDVLYSNFYSYTQPDFPFINHHWLSGVVFYLVFKLVGFSGLSFLYFLLSCLIFLLFFDIAKKESSFWTAFFCSFLLLPLMASRAEIRPEGFSYLFAGAFFWILWNYKRSSIWLNYKILYLLPFLCFIWANLHIYFFLGIAIFALFLFLEVFAVLMKEKNFEKVFKKQKHLIFSFLLTVLASLSTPFNIKGLLYPLNIFKNYGYMIIENQSVWFLEKLNIFNNPNFLLFKISLFLVFAGFLLLLFLNPKRFSFFFLGLALVFSYMAIFAIRNFSIFAFFSLPVLAFCLENSVIKKAKENIQWKNFSIGFFIVLFIVSFYFNSKLFSLRLPSFGLGLEKGNSASAQFFKDNDIKGPVFNNYDIGSYLIFYLFPKEKVFTDNRPEAYPADFFEKTYIPMQEKEEIFKEQDEKFGFNAVFFAYKDATPHGQAFLTRIIDDNLWVPVFVDQYAIIFLKRNEQNKAVIEKYQIPRSFFTVRK